MELVHAHRKVLHVPAKKIEDVDVTVLVREMIETMDRENGVGLAAPQVGYGIQLFVVRESLAHDVTVVLNPTLLEVRGPPTRHREGCLSLPGQEYLTIRYNTIVVEYTNLDGTIVVEEMSGLRAHIFQHELDHLNGKLIYRFRRV